MTKEEKKKIISGGDDFEKTLKELEKLAEEIKKYTQEEDRNGEKKNSKNN